MNERQEEGYLNSIQVGKPAEHPPNEVAHGNWKSGIFKHEVRGPVLLRRENLVGDGQQNLRVHGGPDRAVLSYAAAHYVAWAAELGEELPVGFAPGAFGENFTMSGLDEVTVCLGDVYEIGEVLIEVSQPRLPCANLARRWELPSLPKRVEETGRGGWYARVLQEGLLQAGQVIYRRSRPFPDWTIVRLQELYFTKVKEADATTRSEWAKMAECTALSDLWRGQIRMKLDRAN